MSMFSWFKSDESFEAADSECSERAAEYDDSSQADGVYNACMIDHAHYDHMCADDDEADDDDED